MGGPRVAPRALQPPATTKPRQLLPTPGAHRPLEANAIRRSIRVLRKTARTYDMAMTSTPKLVCSLIGARRFRAPTDLRTQNAPLQRRPGPVVKERRPQQHCRNHGHAQSPFQQWRLRPADASRRAHARDLRRIHRLQRGVLPRVRCSWLRTRCCPLLPIHRHRRRNSLRHQD